MGAAELPAPKRNYQLPRGDAATMLRQFATITGSPVLFMMDKVQGEQTNAVNGEYSPSDALKLMLAGTSLEIMQESAVDGYVVGRKKPSVQSGVVDGDQNQQPQTKMKHTKAVTFILALLGWASAPNMSAQAVAPSAAGSPSLSAQGANVETENSPANKKSAQAEQTVTLEQMTVTAGKRSDTILNIPMAVSAVTAESLTDYGKMRIQDYFAEMPGIEFTYGNLGVPFLSVRGLSTGFLSTPTVGVLLDDIPIGSSTSLGYGYWTPDIDPSDLSQVELLRGPQGTLYGANSMGGLLNYVTADPSTAYSFGHLQGTLDSVYNGSDLGYSIRGTVNTPISKTLALRVSAFSRHDAGYIDEPLYRNNTQEGRKGFNISDHDGATVSALWLPWQPLSLKLTAIYQDSRNDGVPGINPAVGPLDAGPFTKGTGWSKNQFGLVALNANLRLDNFKITSSTGYQMTNIGAMPDFTDVFSPYLTLPPNAGVAGPTFAKTNKISEELRVSASLGDRIDFLGGLYGSYEKTSLPSYLYSLDPLTGDRIGVLFSQQGSPTSFADYAEGAAFVNVTGKVTKQFEVELGARETANHQTYKFTDEGIIVTTFGLPPVVPKTTSHDSQYTYLATAKYKITPELMTYFRVASGYQPGGPNAGIPASENIPPTFSPDTSVDTEVGAKGDLLNHRLSFDVAAYSIVWKDIQTPVYDPNFFQYTLNSGRARSRGLEISLNVRPTEGLSLSAWVAWNQATLITGFPANALSFGVPGDRLPYSQPISGHVEIKKEFALTQRWRAFAEYQVSYVGERTANFRPNANKSQYYIPSYTKSDIRFALRRSDWTLSLYITNLADTRGWTNYHPPAPNSNLPPSGSIIQPRTIGTSVTYSF